MALETTMLSVLLTMSDSNVHTLVDPHCCLCSECVEILLMHGATVLLHDAVMRRTPLHAAGEHEL